MPISEHERRAVQNRLVEIAGVRGEMATGFAHVDARFAEMMSHVEHEMRLQLVWLIATLAALASIVVAILH